MKQNIFENLLATTIILLYLLFVVSNYEFLAQSDVYTLYIQLCFRIIELQDQFHWCKWWH